MAVTDAQIRAVLAANPNASDERILKALTSYGVSPERFTAVTGRTLGATPAPAPVYQPPTLAPTPAPVYQQPATVPAPALPAITPAPPVATPARVEEPLPIQTAQAPGLIGGGLPIQTAQAPGLIGGGLSGSGMIDSNGVPIPTKPTTTATSSPVGNTAPAATARGVPYSQIITALKNNPNATPERIVEAMQQYGVTPDDIRRATGATMAENAPIRQAYGQAGGYTDEQVRNAVMGRAGEQGGFVTQPEIQKAAQNYGITPEQLARVFPQVRPGSLNQAPVTTEQTGLMPAVSAIGRAADVTQETSRQGQQELLDRLSALEGRVGGIYDTAQGYQQTYRDLGQEAAQRQAALTGALGPEAQAQAFAEYQASPALDYLQQQSERALTRQAAALGGLGGGNVRQDLVRLTADLYGQDYANQFARLGEIAQRGYGAAGTSAQLGGQQAGTIAGVGQAGATTAAQMQDALSGRLGNLLGTEAQYRLNTGQNISDVIGAGTTGISGLQVGVSDAYRNLYGNLTDAQLQFGTQLAKQFGDTFANQWLNQANAFQAKGANLSGVQGQTFTPVPGYNIGSAFDAYGRAVDLAPSLFGGTGGNSSAANAQTATGGYSSSGTAASTGADPFAVRYF